MFGLISKMVERKAKASCVKVEVESAEYRFYRGTHKDAPAKLVASRMAPEDAEHWNECVDWCMGEWHNYGRRFSYVEVRIGAWRDAGFRCGRITAGSVKK